MITSERGKPAGEGDAHERPRRRGPDGPNPLGEFLRSRRARIRPEDAGVRPYGRKRRVPGLRREEVAALAGVSPDYYVRLEQGRGSNVSDAVLDAVARVLRLDEDERAHLRDLVRPGRRLAPGGGRRLRPGVRVLLDAMAAVPAFVLGRRMDVLGWNDLGDRVCGFTAMRRPNMAWHVFCDPAARDRYADWDDVAAETVAYLRLDAGRHPGDAEMDELLGELAGAEGFDAIWARRDVRDKKHGRKRLRHPEAGELDLAYETLALPGDPDQLMVVYTAAPGSAAERRLSAFRPRRPG